MRKLSVLSYLKKFIFAIRHPRAFKEYFLRGIPLWSPKNFNKKRIPYFFVFELPLFKFGNYIAPQVNKGNFNTFFDEHKFIESRIKPESNSAANRFFVDIGAGDGIDMSNTYLLAKRGWRGISIEYSGIRFNQLSSTYRNFQNVNLVRVAATPSNIAEILLGLGAHRRIDVLNIDIDGYDFFVLRKVLEKFEVGLVVAECNMIYRPGIHFALKYTQGYSWEAGSPLMGASLQAFYNLGKEFNYKIVGLQGSALFMSPRSDGTGELGISEAYDSYLSGRKDWITPLPEYFAKINHYTAEIQVKLLREKFREKLDSFELEYTPNTLFEN
jgi:hypothetical protein